MSETNAPSPGWIAWTWLQALHPDEHGRGGDRGALARLRRSETAVRALLQPEAMDLYDRLCASSAGARSRAYAADRLARGDAANDALRAVGVVAAVSAQAPYEPVGKGKKQPSAPTFAEALGRTGEGLRPKEDETARLSPNRFAALIRAGDWDARLRHLRRAMRSLKGAPFDVARFAEDLLFWGEASETRWIFAYHQNLRAIPERAKLSHSEAQE